MKPYSISADLHLHDWSAFSSANEAGINSRLAILHSELLRQAEETKKAGGDHMVIAGDTFHVRGSLAPLVLNPTKDCFKQIIESGVKVTILAGNHDLEGKHSTRLSSAVTALEDVGCRVINTFEHGLRTLDDVVLIPWTQNVEELKAKIEEAWKTDPDPESLDLILHAPIDGVINGLPDHGLTDKWLSEVGFRRVFAGHYHQFKDFGNGVYSIGALAHHTWGDVGTKAGFLLVTDTGVKRFASHAPSFVEIDGSVSAEDMPLLANGNYVRVKLNTSKASDVEAARQFLTDNGAKGVTVIAQRDPTTVARSSSTVRAGASIETSVNEFVKASGFANQERLARLCDEIMGEVRGAA